MRGAALLLCTACSSMVSAPAMPTARFPQTWGAESGRAGALLAVLDFRNKLKGADADSLDAAYFTNAVRAGVKRQAPSMRVMTRENVLVLLESEGKRIEDCEGECEVDTGRRLGADYVVSGELLRIGTSFKLDLRLHETREGQLLRGAAASGRTADELDANAAAAIGELLAPLQ
jgi:TolB-like protein